MAKIIFITGGARSGKSSYAQKRAEELAEHPIYLATARVWDEDFRQRIERHKADRGPHWTNLEVEKDIGDLDCSGKTVLLDCVTLWLNNFFFDHNYDLDICLEKAKAQWDKFINQEFTLIVVSNEIGMGVHPESFEARKFADLQGWMNQYIARSATDAILMVSGMPLKLK